MKPIIKKESLNKATDETIAEMDFQLLCGDTREILKTLKSGSVQCVVTSPPYWNLRDYQTAQWIGGDITCQHFVGNQVADNKNKKAITTGIRPGNDNSTCKRCGAERIDSQLGLENTPEEYIDNMVKVFSEIKRVLKNDGTVWLNIGDSYSSSGGSGSGEYSKRHTQFGKVIKSGTRVLPRKPTGNLKPKDLVGIPWMLAFALRNDGWYLRQDIIWSKPNTMPESCKDRCTKNHEYIFLLTKSKDYYYDQEAIKEDGVIPAGTKGAKGSVNRLEQNGVNSRPNEYFEYNGKRNKRSVWTVQTYVCKDAHFATFPPDLITPCILAGSKKEDLVCDPFMGSGTTGMVCRKLGRKFVGIELNPKYIEIAKKRIIGGY